MRKRLIRKLHELQKYRRGGRMPLPDPKETGHVIDDCIRVLRGLSDEQVNDILNEKKNF